MTEKINLIEKYGCDTVEVGRVFVDATELYTFLQDYSLNVGKKIKLVQRGGRFRMYSCRDNSCSWKVKACISKNRQWKISFVKNVHFDKCTCQSHHTPRQLGEIKSFKTAVIADKETKMKSIITSVQLCDKFDLSDRSSTLYKVKDVLTKNSIEDYNKSFCKMTSFLREYSEINEGSNVSLQSDSKDRFYGAFISNKQIIDSLGSCQGVYGMDAGHCKGRYNGVVLILVARDGNGSNLMVCFAVVPKESKEHYVWFLLNCAEAGVSFSENVIFVDRSSSILGAEIELRFKGFILHLRFCTIHIIRNCRHQFKISINDCLFENLIYKLQGSLTFDDYICNLDIIEEKYGKVRNYLSMIECERWILGANVKATCTSFSNPYPFPLYGWRSTNFVESENNSILVNSLRKSNPFNAVRTGCVHLLNEFTSRQKLAIEFLEKELVITPFATKILQRQDASKGEYKVMPHTLHGNTISFYVFHPSSTNVYHKVEINKDSSKFSCDCNFFDQHGLPCKHMFRVMDQHQYTSMKIEYSICPTYTIEKFISAFAGGSINIPNGKTEQLCTIKPAPTYLQAGRPKNPLGRFQKRRFKSKGENAKGKTTKVKKIKPKTMKSTNTLELANNPNDWLQKELEKINPTCIRNDYVCSLCHQVGHNRSNCQSFTTYDIESKHNPIEPGIYVLGREPIFFSREKKSNTGIVSKNCSDDSIYIEEKSPCEFTATSKFGEVFADTTLIDEKEKDCVYPCLSKEKLLSITEIMSSQKKADIIVSNFDINISTEIFQQLDKHNLLGDEIVNYWVGMLNELDQTEEVNQYCCNTWYYVKIQNNHFDDVYSWLSQANVNIFQLDRFIMPININNTHWMLCIVYPKKI